MTSSTLTDDDLAFLASLEAQLSLEAADGRAHPRFNMELAFSVRPADTSRSQEPERAGRTLDVSRGGFRANASRPLSIGDHYRVRLFADPDEPVEIIARCLRCAFVDEQRFEVVLRFVAALEPGVLPIPAE